jgi:hypothetical protein
MWIEEDYCSPPLAMERKVVLDRYFDDVTRLINVHPTISIRDMDLWKCGSKAQLLHIW